MKRAVVTVIGVLALAGCSSSEEGEGAPEALTPNVSESVPRVSTATFCRLVFESGSGDNPLQDATALVRDFASNPDPSELDQERLESTKKSLDSLALRAPEELAPHVEAQSRTIQVLISAHNDPVGGQTISLETFRSSGLELATACGG